MKWNQLNPKLLPGYFLALSLYATKINLKIDQDSLFKMKKDIINCFDVLFVTFPLKIFLGHFISSFHYDRNIHVMYT